MGKKTGQAQRVKDNAQPSSSAKAAEMLLQQATTGLIGFNLSSADVTPIGLMLDDAFDASIDSDLRMCLRKLSKKDALTKCKALDELKSLIETKSNDDCVAILPYWAKSYQKLTFDYDRKVRETCQMTHEKLCQKVNKSLAPHLKTIMPYWLIAQSDSYSQAGKIAEAAFKSIFNETKQPEVVYFAREEILSVLHDYLIVQTMKSMSDSKSTLTEDEAQQRYETIICICLRGLDLFLKYYSTSQQASRTASATAAAVATTADSCIAKLDSILIDQKFWKYSKDAALKIKIEFFQLLYSTIDTILLLKNNDDDDSEGAICKLKTNFKAKLVPLIFYACDEENNLCCYYVWQSINKCLNRFGDSKAFWLLFNVKKAFWPKLFTLLKHHATGTANSQNVDIVYSSLLNLLKKMNIFLNDSDSTERLTFYREFFSKLNDGTKTTGNNNSSVSRLRSTNAAAVNRMKIIDAAFDCICFAITEIQLRNDRDASRSDETEFCSELIRDHALSMIFSYLEDCCDNQQQHQTFDAIIQTKVESLIESVLNKNDDLNRIFWTNLSKWIDEKFQLNENDSVELKSLSTKVLENFCQLLRGQSKVVKSDELLKKIVQIMFQKYVTTFVKLISTERDSDKSSTAVAEICLSAINKILNELYDELLLNSFASNSNDNNYSLENFLRTDLKKLTIRVRNINDDNNDSNRLLFGLLDLFLIVNVKHQETNKNSDLSKEIDEYLPPFDAAKFLNYYFNDNTSSIVMLNASQAKNHLFVWLYTSESFQKEMLERFFKASCLFNDNNKEIATNFRLAINFMNSLTAYEIEDSGDQLKARKQSILKLYNDSLIRTVNEFIQSTVTNAAADSKWFIKNNLNELNNLISFSIGFLFRGNTNHQSASIDSSNIWPIFLNCLHLKNILKSESTVAAATIGSNLHDLLQKCANKLARTMIEQPTALKVAFEPYLKMRNTLITSNRKALFDVNNLTLNLIDYFRRSPLPADRLRQLFIEVLLISSNATTAVVYRQVKTFYSTNQEIAFVLNDFLANLYLDRRFNFAFNRFQPQLFADTNAKAPDSVSDDLLVYLKQIEFNLLLLNELIDSAAATVSAKESTEVTENQTELFVKSLLVQDVDEKSTTTTQLFKLGQLFALLKAALSLNYCDSSNLFSGADDEAKSYGTDRLDSIRTQLNRLLTNDQTSFISVLFKSLSRHADESLLQRLVGELLPVSNDQTSFYLGLNDLSLFLGILVELGIERSKTTQAEANNFLSNLVRFVQDLVHSMVAQQQQQQLSSSAAADINLKEVQYYLFDLPFAKYSLTQLLNSGNLKNFYDFFSHLLTQSLKQTIEFGKQLQITDPNADNNKERFSFLLSKFNFNFDLFLRYLQLYVNFLETNSSPTDLLGKHLNIGHESLDFLKNQLAIYLNDILDTFVGIKNSIADRNAKSGSKTSSYYFYFDEDFDSTKTTTSTTDHQLKWQQFLFIDKLNNLLKVFFIDFKLYLKRTSTNQVVNDAEEIQLSQYLNAQNWDFVLCYTASFAQRLNKISADSFILDSFIVRIAAINFYDYVYPLVKCMQIKVRDNKPGSYPRTIYTDWNGFFAKEIFDPTLCLFVKIADLSRSKNRDKKATDFDLISLKLFKCLGATVSLIRLERLIFNDLEPKFNVLDLNTTGSGASVLHLPDKLKTAFNHLTPHLSHDNRCIQFATYKILKEIMRKMSDYYARVGKSLAQAKSEESSDVVLDEGDDDDNEEEKATTARPTELNIIESLPQVVSDRLKSSINMFSDLKKSFQFDQNILVVDDDDYLIHDDEDEDEEKEKHQNQVADERHNANRNFMTYMLTNRLIFDMFSTENLEFKVKLVNNLRDLNLNDNLMQFLFRVMPEFKMASTKLFAANVNADFEDLDDLEFESMLYSSSSSPAAAEHRSAIADLNRVDLVLATTDNSQKTVAKKIDDLFVSFSNHNIQMFACKLFKHALRSVPAMIRDWWCIQPKRVADYVDKYTTKHISPVILEEEIRTINRQQQRSPPVDDGGDEEQSMLKTRGILSSREIISTYKMKELNMELIIQLPVNHPLGVIDVTSVRRLGVDEKQWRNWLLQLTTYLTHQNGSITQSLQIWKKNVDKKFAGVEECTICYAVIHGTNYQLPKIKCRTCRKLFHSVCLYKWFESSSKSTCPLCRNLFYV